MLMTVSPASNPSSSDSRQKFRAGCWLGALLAILLFAVLAVFTWNTLTASESPLSRLGMGPSATPTRPPATATSTLTPVPPTFTPSDTPTETQTSSPTVTATVTPSQTPSPTPTITDTPTETLTPTETPLVVTSTSQAFCRYGPSTAFLPNVDIYEGDRMVVDGRYEYGGWLWVKPDKVDRHCWIAASLVTPTINLSEVWVVDYRIIMPFTDDIEAPTNVVAVRNGDKVKISWDPTNVKPEAFRGYLIDAWVCQDTIFFKYIAHTNETSIIITDQQNTCAGTSGAVFYGVTKWGYTDPTIVTWP